MAGFIRRYPEFPNLDTLTAIEGVAIIDLPPPGVARGIGVGTVAMVGEYADMTYGVTVDSSGVVATKAQPVEVFSAQELLEKGGGFDSTLGNFGTAMGNAFVELRNKKFSRLVIVPVNFASSRGIRLWRDLPTNKSATDTTPAIPMAAAAVVAGREFKSGANRVHTAKRVVFLDTAAYAVGTDGAVTAAGAPAATQVFTAAGGDFITRGVKEGDALVLGVIGAAGAQGANADTYRIVSVGGATTLTVEKQDGTSFDWTTGVALAWRLHVGETADSGPLNQLSEAGGYLIPARPLDATIAAATLLTPTVVPPAPTATSWDPLAGLSARTMPGGTDLVYTAAVQAPNAVNNAAIDALYETAIDALLAEESPARDVNIVVTARKSSTIRTKLLNHVRDASARGVGRRTMISPELTTVALSSVFGSADPGVGARRDERLDYAWPGALTAVPEAVGVSIVKAGGGNATDGILDTTLDTWLASVESVLAPERNPGEATPTTRDVLRSISGFQRGSLPTFDIASYVQFRQFGVVALRFDRTAGPIFQSGVTTSLTAGQKNIARRRMADYIQDSLAERLVAFSKLPLTRQLKDTITGEVTAFLSELLSVDAPALQRIADYAVDDKSGNTPALEARGVFVVIAQVRTLATADVITLQTEIGEGVVTTASV